MTYALVRKGAQSGRCSKTTSKKYSMVWGLNCKLGAAVEGVFSSSGTANGKSSERLAQQRLLRPVHEEVSEAHAVRSHHGATR